jgi:hypothetical protein
MVARLLDVHNEIIDDSTQTGCSLNGAAIGNKTHCFLSHVALSSEVVRVKKTRQIRNLEPRSDLIGAELQADHRRGRRIERQRNACEFVRAGDMPRDGGID